MNNKRIAVVGAGPGGLAAAMMLSSWGYHVDVFEKHGAVGGRASNFTIDDYRFERGPTFLSMPFILEELFASSGRVFSDYVQLERVDPMYDLIFPNLTFQPSSDPALTRTRIAEAFPGEEQGYDRFMKETGKKWERLLPVLQTEHRQLRDYVSKRAIKALPNLSIGRSLYDELSRFFTDERLKLSFTFQSKYLGMSPWKCPGAFSILSYMEHRYGVYYPIGGFQSIADAMKAIIEENGGNVFTHTEVSKVMTKNKKAIGISLSSGEAFHYDQVIVNADFGHAITQLFEEEDLNRWTPRKLKKKQLSCSSFMLYLGVKKTFDANHHNIYFSNDYKKNVEEISEKLVLSRDPSFYVHHPSVSDSSVDKHGQTSLYVLAPVPNNRSQIDWSKEKSAYSNHLLEKMQQKTNFTFSESDIDVMSIYTPEDWEQDMNVYEGATFNLGHQLSQMMYFRPHNRFQDVENCWLVGGGTHPGSGLPTIYESARITAKAIEKTYGRLRDSI
ncbi:phytoene desaturase [Bacillaceae bacterium JMAK1]|nr:phytoene desaturase [Bacillaceae bacterium JMAK1]